MYWLLRVFCNLRVRLTRAETIYLRFYSLFMVAGVRLTYNSHVRMPGFGLVCWRFALVPAVPVCRFVGCWCSRDF